MTALIIIASVALVVFAFLGLAIVGHLMAIRTAVEQAALTTRSRSGIMWAQRD